MGQRRRRVWIINPYGALPSEGWRATRTVLLASTLAESGFEVTWFRSAFSHIAKRTTPTAAQRELGIEIRAVRACAYTRNISVRRLVSEAMFAVSMLRDGRAERAAPDVIIAGHATQFSGVAAALLARYYHVPLVIDMFDLWPEAFRLVLPPRLRALAPLVFGPLYLIRRLVFRRASAVIALARVNLEVARAVATRASADRCLLVYEGFDSDANSSDPSAALPATLTAASTQAHVLRVVYAGTLGQGYDIDGIVKAARILRRRGVPVQFIVAGDGPGRAKLEAAVASDPSPNLAYVGSLSPPELSRLYRESHVGLCPYLPDSTVAMPCKVYDYFAGGLAIISSLRGELEELLTEKQIGVQYRSGSAESLADAIAALASDRVRLDALRANARGEAARFERRAQYAKVVRLLDDLVPPRARSVIGPALIPQAASHLGGPR